jgi:chromosome partitioning protein
VFAVVNFKGGVGKTTTALNLAAAWAQHRHRVLLIDLDPGATLTKTLGVPVAEDNPSAPTAYRLLTGKDHVSLAEVIHHVAFDAGDGEALALDIVPANRHLASIVFSIHQDPGWGLVLGNALAQPLAYDAVVIDCPPEGETFTYLALGAATDVVVVVQAEVGAVWSLSRVEACIRNMGRLNPGLRGRRYVITMINPRTTVARTLVAELRREFDGQVCDTTIQRTIKLAESMMARQPILTYDPGGEAADSYRRLAVEIWGGAEGAR